MHLTFPHPHEFLVGWMWTAQHPDPDYIRNGSRCNQERKITKGECPSAPFLPSLLVPFTQFRIMNNWKATDVAKSSTSASIHTRPCSISHDERSRGEWRTIHVCSVLTESGQSSPKLKLCMDSTILTLPWVSLSPLCWLRHKYAIKYVAQSENCGHRSPSSTLCPSLILMCIGYSAGNIGPGLDFLAQMYFIAHWQLH